MLYEENSGQLFLKWLFGRRRLNPTRPGESSNFLTFGAFDGSAIFRRDGEVLKTRLAEVMAAPEQLGFLVVLLAVRAGDL